MKVRDIIELICPYAKWELVGAKTGHKLCKCSSSNKHKSKFMDCEVPDAPIFTKLISSANDDYAYPVVCIWVSGR